MAIDRPLLVEARLWREARRRHGEHGKHGEQHGEYGEQHGKHGKQHGKHGKQHGKHGEQHGKHGEQHGKHGEQHGKHGEQHGKHGKHGKPDRLRDIVRSARAPVVSELPSSISDAITLKKKELTMVQTPTPPPLLDAAEQREVAQLAISTWLRSMLGVSQVPAPLESKWQLRRLERLLTNPQHVRVAPLSEAAREDLSRVEAVPSSSLAGRVETYAYRQLDREGRTTELRTEAILSLDDKLPTPPPAGPVPRLNLSLARFREPFCVRSRDKDWRTVSFRAALGEWRPPKRRHELGRYPRDAYALFGLGTRTVFAAEHGCALGTEVISRRVWAISKHACILSVVAVGFGGRAYLPSHETVNPRRHLAFKAYLPEYSTTCTLNIGMSALEATFDDDDVLAPGRRSDLVDELCARLYFKYHCSWRAERVPPGARRPSPAIGANNFDKSENEDKTRFFTTRRATFEHLDPWLEPTRPPGEEPGAAAARVEPELCVAAEQLETGRAARHAARLRRLADHEVERAERRRRWLGTPKRYRGCVAAFASTVSNERVVFRFFQLPGLCKSIVRLVVTRFPSMAEHSLQLTLAEIRRVVGSNGGDDDDDDDAFLRRVPLSSAFVNEAKLDADALEREARRVWRQAAKGTARVPLRRYRAVVAPPTLDLDSYEFGGRVARASSATAKKTNPAVAPGPRRRCRRRHRKYPNAAGPSSRREAGRGRRVVGGVARLGRQLVIFEVIRRPGAFLPSGGDLFDVDVYVPAQRRRTLTLHMLDLMRVAKRRAGTARAAALEAPDHLIDSQAAARAVATAAFDGLFLDEIGVKTTTSSARVIDEFVLSEERAIVRRSKDAWLLTARDLIASLDTQFVVESTTREHVNIRTALLAGDTASGKSPAGNRKEAAESDEDGPRKRDVNELDYSPPPPAWIKALGESDDDDRAMDIYSNASGGPHSWVTERARDRASAPGEFSSAAEEGRESLCRASWHRKQRGFPHPLDAPLIPRSLVDDWLERRFEARPLPTVREALLRDVDDLILLRCRRSELVDTRALRRLLEQQPKRWWRLRFDTRLYRTAKLLRTVKEGRAGEPLFAVVTVSQKADVITFLVEETVTCLRVPVLLNPREQRALASQFSHISEDQTTIQLAVMLENLVARDGNPSLCEPPVLAEFKNFADNLPDYDNGRSKDIMQELDAAVTARWGRRGRVPTRSYHGTTRDDHT